MDRNEIYRHIDYTLLKPTATSDEIYDLCVKAIDNNCASVCIPSSYVDFVHDLFPSLNICTVVGFPLGNSSTCTKVMEAMNAVIDGANEIDMVMNIADLKSGHYTKIINEINTVKSKSHASILKVIIETCYLTENEIAVATQLISQSSAEFIKTSTGFGTRGASFKDIEIISKNIKYGLRIKASGGIRTYEDMVKYIDMGCERIGASVLPQ